MTNPSELSLEVINNITDFDEWTNHWLNVITAKCIRQFGPLNEEELKGVGQENKEKTEIEPAEKNLLETIENLKRDRQELFYEDIQNQMEVKLTMKEFEDLIAKMIRKNLIKQTSDRHYDVC